MSKLDYLQQKKLSPADELREILSSLEERQVKVRLMDSTKALILLRDLDQLYLLFKRLEETGLNLLPEQGRFDTVQARLKETAAPLLKALGGPDALNEYRPAPVSPREQWWWYLHDRVAQQRQSLRRRVIAVAAIILLVLSGVVLAFNTVLAPSPAVIARIEAENEAYNAIDGGDFRAALAIVKAGLVEAPGDPVLIIFKGVLQEGLGQETEAAESFARAQANFDDPRAFYFGRGQLQLRIDRPVEAERDARAAIAINESSADAWLLLGQALEVQGKNLEAVPAYEKASQLALESGDDQIVVLARIALGRIGGAP